MTEQAKRTIENGSKPSDYKPYSDCEICDGSGWIWHDTYDEAGIRTSGGSEKCVCRKRNDNIKRMERSGLGHVIEELTLHTFTTEEPWQRAMRATAEKYIAVITAKSERTAPWFYIGGAVGSGKTHIATAICGELLNRGMGVRYMQWLPEARRIKSMINSEDLDGDLDKYRQADVLYIDDLFKQQHHAGERPYPTDADVKIAFMLINDRYTARKPTIITSEWNLTDELLDIDEGTFSRVYERTKGGYLIEIENGQGKNYRTRGVTQ